MRPIDDLAKALRAAYADEDGRGKVVSIHLFGIMYAEAIAQVSLDDLTRKAVIPESYGTEIRKGMNLARYVMLR